VKARPPRRGISDGAAAARLRAREPLPSHRGPVERGQRLKLLVRWSLVDVDDRSPADGRAPRSPSRDCGDRVEVVTGLRIASWSLMRSIRSTPPAPDPGIGLAPDAPLETSAQGPRCSANSRSTRDGFGSATATATHENSLSSLYHEFPSQNWQTKLRPDPGRRPGPTTNPSFRFRGVQFLARDSLSMNRSIHQRGFTRRFTCTPRQLA